MSLLRGGPPPAAPAPAAGARPPGWWGALACFGLVPLASLLDRAASGAFWFRDEGFFLRQRWPLLAVYHGTQWAISFIAAALLLALLGSFIPAWVGLRTLRPRIWFAVIALAIGPGTITHLVFKDHWGRPRPAQIADFGGPAHYVPPWEPSDQCSRNCSFPSGHAAAGFYLITGAWIWPAARRRWLSAGLIAGGGIGLVRIMQGGHFLSDVVGALAVVWSTNCALEALGLLRPIRAEAESPTRA